MNQSEEVNIHPKNITHKINVNFKIIIFFISIENEWFRSFVKS